MNYWYELIVEENNYHIRYTTVSSSVVREQVHHLLLHPRAVLVAEVQSIDSHDPVRGGACDM